MRIKQDASVIESLLDYSNFNTAETLHKKLVDNLYRFCQPATQASFEGVCRRYVDWCKSQPRIECAYKFFAYPADTVEAFLESGPLRHVQQGDQPGLTVENAYTEVHKLSKIQGCPAFTQTEIHLMKSAVGRARSGRDKSKQRCPHRRRQ